MRLRVLKDLIKNNYEKLNVKAENLNGKIHLTNYKEAMNAISQLDGVSFLDDDINNLKSFSDIYYSRTEKIIIDTNEYSNFMQYMNTMKMKCKAVIEAIEAAIPEQNEFSISVKLPKINNLGELSEFSDSLNKVLSQAIINEYFEGRVELQNFDSGSYWLEIIVGSGIALNFVAGLAWSAAVIRKKIYEGEITKQNIRTLKIKNDSLEEIESALDSELNILCEAEAKQLLLSNNIETKESEYINRVKFSIKTLAELIQEGTEIHHALNAPEDVRNLFPDFSKIGEIESRIKYLPKNE